MIGCSYHIMSYTLQRSRLKLGTDKPKGNCLVRGTCQRSAVGSCVFPVADPKTWNALLEDVTSSCSLNTPLAASSKCGFSRSLFRTSSSDTDCILTFSLGLSVPTLRRFCRVRVYDMIYDMI